jgi:hypothetical protein
MTAELAAGHCGEATVEGVIPHHPPAGLQPGPRASMKARTRAWVGPLPSSGDDTACDPALRALFVDEDELHRRIAPHMGKDRFRAAVRACEQRRFPKVSMLWRGRYWPAVKIWLDDENGVGDHGCAGIAQDGPENFDASAR